MATAQSGTVLADNSTDANYRAWVAATISVVTGAGWAQTADTGQVDPATVLKPTAGNQGNRDYAMFSKTDSVGTLYLRIGFGSASAQNRPNFRFDVGFATDGAGNLTGNALSQQPIGMPSVDIDNNSTTARPFFACGRAGGLVLVGFDGNPASVQSPSMLFSVGRTVDATGAITGDGLLVMWFQGQFARAQQIVRASAYPGTATAPRSPRTGIALAMDNATSNQYGGNTIFAAPILYDTQSFNSGINLLFVGNADIPEGALPTVTLYGTAHTYRRINTGNRDSSSWSNLAICMLWE